MNKDIIALADDQVFVFGSNLNGYHGGGAAKLAHEKFGAVWGNGRGMQGQSWALPTLGFNMEKLPIVEIQESLHDLVEYAQHNPNKTFFLTKIGQGIAGFSREEIESVLPKLPENIIKVNEWK